MVEARARPRASLVERAARWLLLTIATLAVFAPFLANDEPYVLVAVDRGAYASSYRTLRPITAALVEAATTERALEVVDEEGGAARLRIATLERYLVPRLHRAGADYLAALDELERAVLGDEAAASQAATRLEEAGARLRDELEPERVAREEAFLAAVSSPLLRSLSWGEITLALGWCGLLVSLSRPRWTWRRRATVTLAGLALSAVVALVVTSPSLQRPRLSSLATKAALTEGTIEASLALFPPLSMGYAETHLAESYRPPTWLRSSHMTEEGEYVDLGAGPSGREGTGERADAGGIERPPAVPVEVRRGEPGLNSGLRHPFGTDAAGRDVLARVVWGGRASLTVGFLSAVLLTLLGTAVGALAGTFGGRVDFLLSRGVEVMIAFPAYFLVLAVMSLVDPDVVPPIVGLVVVIALTSWTGIARLVRAEFLRLREADFVLAARALGYSTPRIVLQHILPNAFGPVLVAFAFAFAGGIFVESTISFLGFGIDRPTPSWGALIAESSSPATWWLQVFPGLAILTTVVCVHAVGGGWRRAYHAGTVARVTDASDRASHANGPDSLTSFRQASRAGGPA